MTSNADNVIPIGAQAVPGVYFLRPAPPLPAWIGKLPETPAPRTFADVTHLFTDDVNRRPLVRDELVTLISGAKQKVLFCSFIFADEVIVGALCDAARRLRGGVYVLTALAQELRPDLSDLGEDIDQRAERERQRRRQHEDNLQKLAASGVWLRSVGDCHAKFCVVDDDVALVTSANATAEAYLQNPENGVVLHVPSIAAELGRLFAHVWLHRPELESPPGADLDVKKMPVVNPPPWRSLRSAGDLRLVCTLGVSELSLRDETISLIDATKDELVVASYSAVAIESHPVGAALRRALERGVRLLLVLRPRNSNQEQRAACAWLIDGIPREQWELRAHGRTHAKLLVADSARALFWTGNLDGHNGYESGIEVGVATTRPEIAEAARAYVVDLANRSEHTGVHHPTLQKIATTLRAPPLSGAWTLRIPSNVSGAMPADLAHRLASEVVGYVNLWEGLALRVGRSLLLRVQRDDQAATLTVLPARDLPDLLGKPLDGYVSDCALRIEREAPAPAPTQEPKGNWRRRR